MNLKTCDNCKRMFDSVMGNSLCPNCYTGKEATFKTVRHYIRSHPDSNIFEVSRACDVEIEQIRAWIKEERIEYTKDSQIGIECERCGVLIRTGRYCPDCKRKVATTLSSAYKEQPSQETMERSTNRLSKDEKMRFLNKKNK